MKHSFQLLREVKEEKKKKDQDILALLIVRWHQEAGQSFSTLINIKRRASMFVRGLGARSPGGPQSKPGTGSRLFTTGGAVPKQKEH